MRILSATASSSPRAACFSSNSRYSCQIAAPSRTDRPSALTARSSTLRAVAVSACASAYRTWSSHSCGAAITHPIRTRCRWTSDPQRTKIVAMRFVEEREHVRALGRVASRRFLLVRQPLLPHLDRQRQHRAHRHASLAQLIRHPQLLEAADQLRVRVEVQRAQRHLKASAAQRKRKA